MKQSTKIALRAAGVLALWTCVGAVLWVVAFTASAEGQHVGITYMLFFAIGVVSAFVGERVWLNYSSAYRRARAHKRGQS